MSSPDHAFRTRIQSITPVSVSVLHCTTQTQELIPYEPGQYCMVTTPPTARAYSFVTPPGTVNVEFLIDTAPNGPASKFFRAAVAGDALTFTGPYGNFVLDPVDPRPLLYIAGGTGLAPIMAHLLALLATNNQRPVTLIVGHRSRDDMFWHDRLEHLAATHDFTYRGVVGPFLDRLPALSNLADHTVYICGSAGMCTATAEALYQLNVSPAQVHYELFT